MKSCHAIDRPLNDRRGNSRQLVDCLWLPPISGVRHPDFRKIPKINSPYYYSSNNRERLVGQVSSRGRGWLRSRIHRSEIIPYFGASASSTGDKQGFFLTAGAVHRASPPLPSVSAGNSSEKWKTGQRPYFFSSLCTFPITPPHRAYYLDLPRSHSFCMHYSFKMYVSLVNAIENLVSLVLYSRNFLRRGLEKGRERS